jgi:hypothetical protein
MNGNPPLSKYAARFGDSADTTSSSDAEGTESLAAFGLLRGTHHRAEMLELRKKTGDIRAIGYAWIQKVDFDPSGTITLFFAGDETIRIKGRNLNAVASQQMSLLGGILRHRVPFICEADQSTALQSDNHSIVVEAIEWEA